MKIVSEQSAALTSSATRRDCILSLCALAGLGPSALARAAGPVRLLIVGDSLSAEYGLKRGTGWVALLEARLKEAAVAAEVVNASISGETTSGGRARLDALLRRHAPTHVVIELGANDALRGLPLAETRANLVEMCKRCEAAGARTLLIGMQVPPNYGATYGKEFAAVFGQVAAAQKTALVPFMLAGIADDATAQRWFQADRIHPNELAHPRILDNIWPVLSPWLSGRGAGKAAPGKS